MGRVYLAIQPASQVGQLGGQVPPQVPQGQPATLTAEEVALLGQHQVTYHNGRWVHTELTAKGYISTFVNPRVELNKTIGDYVS